MGGSSKRVTVGYDYYMSADFTFSGADIDSVFEIIYGERSAWRGTVTGNQDIYINNPNLFGGQKREGGVRGLVSILFGGAAQARHPFLQAQISPQVPAYRGYARLLFQNFMWSSMNPYFKSVWVRVKKIQNGWKSGACWYPSRSNIGRKDGVPTNYTITVTWTSQDFKARQTIDYTLQYRVIGSPTWINLVSASFSGGEAPGVRNTLGGQVQINGGVLGSFVAYTAGERPAGERSHVFNLPAAAYEFNALKTSGSRTPPVGAPLVGPTYGGTMAVTNFYAASPSYEDMNPAHILYRLLTESKWQVNIPIAMLDDAKWRVAADVLYAERFGLSFLFNTGVDSKQHIQRVLDHINGYFKHDLASNTISLELIRGGYAVEGLALLDNDNSYMVEYQRSLYGSDVPNEVLVKYRDDNEDVKVSAPATNLGGIQAQGGLIRTEVEYEGVHRADLAYALARRDAKVLGANLAKITRKCNRILWNHTRGDVVLVTDELVGIAESPYRIVGIDKGSFESGEITVELIEDVFGLDTTQFSFADTSVDYDPTVTAPVADARIFELPYYVVALSVSAADRANLPVGYGFASALTHRNSAGAFSSSYDLYYSLDEVLYLAAASGVYSPVGSLSASITKTTTAFSVLPLSDFEVQNLDGENEVLLIVGNELMAIDTLDSFTGAVTVRRGVADTVPLIHAAGTKVYIFSSTAAQDPTTRLVGDVVYYKPQPIGSGKVLPLEDATALPYTFTRRADRPYPPGNFKINTETWPASVAAGDIDFTWAHRDRLSQTVGLVPFEEASIGPEAGTTYTLEFYDGATLLRSQTGISGTSYTYLAANLVLDGDPAEIRVVLFSVVGGLISHTRHEHTFSRPV